MKTRLLIIVSILVLIPMQLVYASPESLQTGETISNPSVMIIIESLGAILIVFFIILYTIKKRMAKKSIEERK